MKQRKHPQKVIDSFLSDIDLDEARKSMKECLEVALTTENDYYKTAHKRNWIIYFYKRLEEFIEAAYLLKSRTK